MRLFFVLLTVLAATAMVASPAAAQDVNASDVAGAAHDAVDGASTSTPTGERLTAHADLIWAKYDDTEGVVRVRIRTDDQISVAVQDLGTVAKLMEASGSGGADVSAIPYREMTLTHEAATIEIESTPYQGTVAVAIRVEGQLFFESIRAGSMGDEPYPTSGSRAMPLMVGIVSGPLAAYLWHRRNEMVRDDGWGYIDE